MSFELLPTLLKASIVTIEIFLMSAVFAVLLAFALGIARVAAPRPIQIAALVITEFLRGVSALILLFWLFFALPLLGISFRSLRYRLEKLGFDKGPLDEDSVVNPTDDVD